MLLRRYHNNNGAAKAAPKSVKQKFTPTGDNFTRTDIETMKYMKLRSVAKKNGVETDDRKAEDIRSELIEKLGL